jgi:hypothetical protein
MKIDDKTHRETAVVRHGYNGLMWGVSLREQG